MRKDKDGLEIVNQQDMKNMQAIKENLVQVLEQEFVMTNLMRGYLNYLRKCYTPETMQNAKINDFLSNNDVLIKKTNGFHISKHNGSIPMYFHKHTYLEMDYVYQGSCSYYIDNEDTEFELKEKELCIVNQNVIHGLKIHSEKDIVFKCFIPFDRIDMKQFDELAQTSALKRFLIHSLDENVTKASYLVFRMEDYSGADDIMFRMFSEFAEQGPGWNQVIDSYLSVLLISLMRSGESKIKLVKELEEENLNITKVLNCIRNNYQFISLKDMARDFHYHENYLSRMIKQHSQMSFRELLSQIRLQESEKLLLHSDLSITEIALKVGYQKPNYFYKLFKDHYGVTPMEFKANSSV